MLKTTIKLILFISLFIFLPNQNLEASEVTPSSITIPAVTLTEFSYSGNVNYLDIPESDWFSVTEPEAVNVGTYQAILSLLDPINSSWSDNSKEDIIIAFEITPMIITLPSVSVTTFRFTGEVQSPLVTPGAGSFVTGTAVSTAGIHTLEVRLFDPVNQVFENSKTTPVMITYEITPLEIAQPVVVLDTVPWLGFDNRPGVNISPGASLVGDLVSNAGIYTFYVVLDDPLNTVFEGGSNASIPIRFEITPRVITNPAIGVTQIAFSGNADGPEIMVYENSSISGSRVGLNVGSYSFEVVLDDPLNMVFENGTNAAFMVDFEITPKIITTPAVLITQFAWSGNVEEPIIDHDIYTTTTYSAISSVGIYSAFILLNDEDNFIFDNGTNVAIKVDYEITPMIVSLPSISVTSYGFTSFDTFLDIQLGVGSNITGTVMATSVGIYTVTVRLDFPDNQTFEDGSIDPITISWEITPLEIGMPVTVFTGSAWSGNENRPEVNVSDGAILTGDLVSDVGIYTFYVELEDPLNTIFSNGSSNPIPVPFEITPMIIDDPLVLNDSFIWQPSLDQTPGIQVAFGSLVTGVMIASNVGSYEVIISVNDPLNQSFEDGSTKKTVTWEITPYIVEVPTFDTLTFSYHPSGAGLTYEDPYVLTSNLQNTKIGSHEALFTLKYPDNTMFENNEDEIKVTYTIEKAVIDLSVLSWDYTFAFNENGLPRTVLLENVPSVLEITYSNHTASEAGIYTASAVAVVDTTFYTLENEIPLLTWKINQKETIDFPIIADESFIYDGLEKHPSYNVSESVTVITVSSVNAGIYEVIFNLNNPDLMMWEDGSVDPLIETYTIEKALIDLNEISLEETFFLEGAVDIQLNNVPDEITVSFTAIETTGRHPLILGVTYASLNYTLLERETPLTYTVYPNDIFLDEDMIMVDERLSIVKRDLDEYLESVEAISLEDGTFIESYRVYTFEADTELDIEDLLSDITYTLPNTTTLLYIYDESLNQFTPYEDTIIRLGDVILELELGVSDDGLSIPLIITGITGLIGVSLTTTILIFKKRK